MSNGVGLQVSPKLPDGTLINIQADDPDELKSKLEWVTENAQLIVETAAALAAAHNVAHPRDVSAQQNRPASGGQQGGGGGSRGGWGNRGGQSQSQGQDHNRGGVPDEFCDHGVAREYKEGWKNGKKWSGLFCVADVNRDDQCKPLDPKTGKPWGER